MKIDKILSWSEYRIILFNKIQELIETSNCNKYTILGYKHVDTKLILHYHDCNRVILFEFDQIGPEYINEDIDKQFKVTSFYTKDFDGDEYLEQSRIFNENFSRDIAEKIED
jgi:hypothetical protein